MFVLIQNFNHFRSQSSLKSIKLISNPIRSAHYVINQDGEKVIVSKRNHIRTKREKWQNVKPMGKEDELKKIQSIERNERLHCDPNEASSVALNKFQQLSDRLLSSGFCRDIKSYHPPDNINEIIDKICKEFFKNQTLNFDSIVFKNLTEKFKFLIRCHQEFNHEVRNSDLFNLNSIGDVRNYYQTPVIGNSKYDSLAYKSIDNLPPNLHVIPEPIRFNPETDTLFNGVSAFPGVQQELEGLRARKKYPSYKNNFIWPDV